MDKKYMLIGGLIIFATWYFFSDKDNITAKQKEAAEKARNATSAAERRAALRNE